MEDVTRTHARTPLVSLVLLALLPLLVQAKYINTNENRDHEFGSSKNMIYSDKPQKPSSTAIQEPRLFEMLMSALEDDTMGPDYNGGGGASKSGSKPCYWSLVSCYKKKRASRRALESLRGQRWIP